MTDASKEIIDGRTGEIIPRGANEEIVQAGEAISFDLIKGDNIGTLFIDDEAKKVLSEKMKPEEVHIRPDGNLYMPWTWYASRLNQAFGIAQWGLLPQGMPMAKPMGKYDDLVVVWGHWLIIRGIPLGFAIGETTYRPSNAMMSYADACEGAKSSSLARNCKILGMTLELWDADYCTQWREKYAEQYTDNKGNPRWKKKGPKSSSASSKTPPPVKEEAKEDTQKANQLTIQEIKNKWVDAAVIRGIVLNPTDPVTLKDLIAILGDTYKNIAGNATAEEMQKGLDIINQYQLPDYYEKWVELAVRAEKIGVSMPKVDREKIEPVKLRKLYEEFNRTVTKKEELPK
ncbi:MAG: hypothetical protein V1775_02225 [Bacteroidota bacterium]